MCASPGSEGNGSCADEDSSLLGLAKSLWVTVFVPIEAGDSDVVVFVRGSVAREKATFNVQPRVSASVTASAAVLRAAGNGFCAIKPPDAARRGVPSGFRSIHSLLFLYKHDDSRAFFVQIYGSAAIARVLEKCGNGFCAISPRARVQPQ